MARILVADDNSNIQKMVALALQDQGVEVTGVGNGEAAVRKVPEIRPDVVLADVFMPVRSGYEVCEFVKSDPRFSHIPVVLLVGAFDPLDEHEAQRVRADGVLKKPFVPPEPLVNLIKALLVKSAGEKLVAVGVPSASNAATAEAPRAKPPVSAPTFAEEMEAEESAPAAQPAPQVSVAEYNRPVAFGALLESVEKEAAALDENDPIVTSHRDPSLGEPAFWSRKAQPAQEAPEEDDSDATEHSWGRSHSLPGLDESAVLEPEEPIELDRDAARVRSLEIPEEEEPFAPAASHEPPVQPLEAAEQTHQEAALTLQSQEEAPAVEEAEPATEAATIGWPGLEEALAEPQPIPQAPPAAVQAPPVLGTIGPMSADPELEAPIGSEPPAVWPTADPTLESTAAQAAERQSQWVAAAERALRESAAQSASEIAPAPDAEHEEASIALEAEPAHQAFAEHEEFAEHALVAQEEPVTQREPIAEPEPAHAALAPDMPSRPSPFRTVTKPAETATIPSPPQWTSKWPSLEDPLPNLASLASGRSHVDHTEPPVTAPVLNAASNAAPAHTPDVPAVPSAPPIFTSGFSPSASETAKAVAEEPAVPASLSPEMMDAVVNRIVERMQPQVLDLITREILRPVVEALVQREISTKK